MSEDRVENIILLQFRRVHDRFDSIEFRLNEYVARIHALEDHVSGLVVSVASINSSIDRTNTRLERIERSLDLVKV